MTPISNNSIQIPIEIRQKGAASRALRPITADVKAVHKERPASPEDIVQLSSRDSSSVPNKNPSIPVSNEEKDALLNDSFGKISFSIYV